MDRIHVLCCKLDAALELLLEAYQIVGNKEYSYEDEDNTY
jgi:hypothetical protein